MPLVFPCDALYRTSIDGLLDELFFRSLRVVTLGLAAVVEAEHSRAVGYTQTAADACVLIDFGYSVHRFLRF